MQRKRGIRRQGVINMSKPKKLCINCIHCKQPLYDNKLATCGYIKKMKKSYITGVDEPIYQCWTFCGVLRSNNSIFDKIFLFMFSYIYGVCGPQGRYYSPKNDIKHNNKR